MLPIALIYGGIAGLVTIATIIIGLLIGRNGHIATPEWLGYLIMFFAFTLIFIGVKDYRDRALGGVIRFLPALGLGVMMAAVASVIYVIVWEIYLALSGNVFITQYVASVIEQMRAAGATPEAIAAQQAEMQAIVDGYANPLYRIPLTFSEIFPVGLLVAVISALVLRNPRILPARQMGAPS